MRGLITSHQSIFAFAGTAVIWFPSAASSQDVVEFEDRFDDFEFGEVESLLEEKEDDAVGEECGVDEEGNEVCFLAVSFRRAGREKSLKAFASFSPSFESNAPQETGGDSDFSLTPAVGAMWKTKSKTDSFSISAGASYSDYTDNIGGDYAYAYIKTGYNVTLSARDEFSASIAGAVLYGDFFEDWKFSRMRLEGGVTHAFRDPKLKNVIVSYASVSARHDFINPSDLNNTYVSFSLPNKIKYSNGWGVEVTPGVSYKRYGDLFGVEREDVGVEGKISVSRKILKDKLKFSATFKVKKRDSTDNLKDYTGVEAPISFKLERNIGA